MKHKEDAYGLWELARRTPDDAVMHIDLVKKGFNDQWNNKGIDISWHGMK